MKTDESMASAAVRGGQRGHEEKIQGVEDNPKPLIWEEEGGQSCDPPKDPTRHRVEDFLAETG